MLEYGDKITRDTSTVQGCINKLNDIIIGFNKFNGNKILATDKFGYPVEKELKTDNNLIGANLHDSDIYLYHKETENSGITYGSNKTYVSPGDKIVIPKITMGEKGHIYSIEDATIDLNNKFPIPADSDWVDGWFDSNGTAYLPGGMNELRIAKWQKILITVNDSMNFILILGLMDCIKDNLKYLMEYIIRYF